MDIWPDINGIHPSEQPLTSVDVHQSYHNQIKHLHHICTFSSPAKQVCVHFPWVNFVQSTHILIHNHSVILLRLVRVSVPSRTSPLESLSATSRTEGKVEFDIFHLTVTSNEISPSPSRCRPLRTYPTELSP